MKKDECSVDKVHHQSRAVAKVVLKKIKRSSNLRDPASLVVYRCNECKRFLIGNIPARFRKTLIEATPEKRIRDLADKQDRDNSENGTLGSLIADWAFANNISLPPKRGTDGQKTRDLNEMIKVWKEKNKR